MAGRSRAGAGKCPPQQLVCDPFIPHTHTESLFSSAILIPPFLCHNKQPIPIYFFLTGPVFATIVLKFGFFWCHRGNCVCAQSHRWGYLGTASSARLSLQQSHIPIRLSLCLGHPQGHCPLNAGEIHQSPTSLACFVTPFVPFWCQGLL